MKKMRRFLFFGLIFLALLPLNGSAAAQTGTVIYVNPPVTQVEPGLPFTVEVWVKDVVNLYAYDVLVNYDSAYLTFNSADYGELLFPDMPVRCEEIETGVVQCAASQQSPHEPTSEDGVLFTITFTAKLDEKYTYLTIDKESVLTDWPNVADLPYTSQDGDVQIGDAEPGYDAFIPVFLH